jgi:polar amino acid transport system ATP-binding protein
MALEVQGLYKSFSGKPVLKDINFNLKQGETLAILGRSGAGKTTILRCINNLTKCDRGTIKVDDMYLCKEENGVTSYAKPATMLNIRKKLGMVFQNFNLFPHMSVMQNIVEAPINVFSVPKKKAHEKAAELLEMLGLSDKADSYPFELSGGQKQRVAIARACALNPKIMCLDEPTSALDPELREGIASIIENLAQDGMGILIITHDMNFAKRVASRVIFMDDGQITQESSKKEFFDSINDKRIKSFVTA